MRNTVPVIKSRRAHPEANGTATGRTAARKLQAELTLASLEKEARASAADRIQAVAEYKLDGTILSANALFLRLFGYAAEEIKGQHHGFLLDPAYRLTAEYRQLWGDLSNGVPFSGIHKCTAKGGRELHLEVHFQAIAGPDGKPTKVVQFASDCTELQKLRDEVKELRVYMDIVNQTSIVSEADLKGDIMRINEKFIEVSKYSREELIGKPHNTTRHPDMSKEVFREMWSTIGKGKTFRGIVKNRAKDGSPYYVDAVIAPVLGENGKPRKYIGVRYEITEAELERQNAKGILAAIDRAYAFIEFNPKGGNHVREFKFPPADGVSSGRCGWQTPPDVCRRGHRELGCLRPILE